MKLDSQLRCIRLAHQALETVTPIRQDCGELCGRACCKGDENTGMWLLPGEAELLQGQEGFSVRPCQDNGGYPLLVCQGSCDRKYRPFACRIYPFFPLATEREDGSLNIRVISDPRAAGCPLARHTLPGRPRDVTQSFRFRLAQAALALLEDPELRRYLLDTSRFLTEIIQLRQKLGQ